MSRKCMSIEDVVGKFDDPSKIAMFTDGGDGAEKVRTYDEQRDGNYYTMRIKIARVLLSRNRPWLVEVFNLIVKNGRFRAESIATLAARHHCSKEVANERYWKHLKKISLFFKAQ